MLVGTAREDEADELTLPQAETAQSCEDGGDDHPEPPHLPTTPLTAPQALLRRGYAWDGERVTPKAFSACSLTCGQRERKQQGGSRRALQRSRPRLVSPLTSALQNRSSYSPRASSHRCAPKCLCLEPSNGSEERARIACSSSPRRRCWVGAPPR